MDGSDVSGVGGAHPGRRGGGVTCWGVGVQEESGADGIDQEVGGWRGSSEKDGSERTLSDAKNQMG